MSPVAIEWTSADSALAAALEPDDVDEEELVELVDVGAVAAEGPVEELLDDPQRVRTSAAAMAHATQSLFLASMRPDCQGDLTFS
jgi:hypothetical protein